MLNSSESLELNSPEALSAKPTNEGLILMGYGRKLIAELLVDRTEANIRTPLTLLEFLTSSIFVEEITVAVRGNAIVILSAKDTEGPIVLPTITTTSDKVPAAQGKNAAPKPRLRLDVQVPSDVDHVAAWSKGGKTISKNCQMLCKTHNRAKGNR